MRPSLSEIIRTERGALTLFFFGKLTQTHIELFQVPDEPPQQPGGHIALLPVNPA